MNQNKRNHVEIAFSVINVIYYLLQMAKEIRIFKPHVKIIFQGVLMPNPPTAVNMLDIYADRAKFLAMTPKKVKQQRNMG